MRNIYFTRTALNDLPGLSALNKIDGKAAEKATVQSLLQLAEETEKQTSLAIQTIKAANISAREKIINVTVAGIKDYSEIETAVQNQLSTLQNHALAVTKSLDCLDKSNDLLTLLSQEILQLNSDMSQAQEEATLAHEKAEKASLEYFEKQVYALDTPNEYAQAKNQIPQSYRTYELEQEWDRLAQKEFLLAKEEADIARKQAEQAGLEAEDKRFRVLSIQDALAKAKRAYDLGQAQIHQYHQNYQLAQQWAFSAKNEYLQMKGQLDRLMESSSQLLNQEIATPISTAFAQAQAQAQAEPSNAAANYSIVPSTPYSEPPPDLSTAMPVVAQKPNTPPLAEEASPLPKTPPLPADVPPLPLQPSAFATIQSLPNLPPTIPPVSPLPHQISDLPNAVPLPKEPIANLDQLTQNELSQSQGTVTHEPKPTKKIKENKRLETKKRKAAKKLKAEAKTNNSQVFLYLRVLIITMVAAICLRLFIIDVAQVNGNSMNPTLDNADILLISKISVKINAPQRYDIIMLDVPDRSSQLIKRIIGLPNEHIAITDGLVFINGRLLEEEYLDNIYTDGDISIVLPDGYYFVMGDNRFASRDSRSKNIGAVTIDNIYGKAILRFYPLNSFSLL